jgi:hypothetical protein
MIVAGLRSRFRKSERKNERGQTLILVAIALVSLLGMAALAIDVVTLYVARGEAQRAADAAAIAGAKMFVTSGFTSVQGSGTPPVTQTDVCQNSGPGNTAAANRQAEAAAGQNQVAGQTAAVLSIACNFTQPRNPQITVTVQRTGLPTFLARIWSRSSITVTATATAEAYNPSGFTTANLLPVVGVKPWLVPNCDPTNTALPRNLNCGGGNSYFVSPIDGSIANNGSFIGNTSNPINFKRIPAGTPPTVSPPPPPTAIIRFYPLDVPINPPTPACPSTGAVSCGQVGSDNYLDNIGCTSEFQFSCGQTIGTGSPGPVTVLSGAALGLHTREGTRCLIHANADNTIDGQDIFSSAGSVPPVAVTGGTENPNTSLQGSTNISRSDSIVTVPLFDGSTYTGTQFCSSGSPPVCTATTTIVGFLQLGIMQTMTGANGQFQAVILNATGCNPANNGNPVSGDGVSPLPVRLISP